MSDQKATSRQKYLKSASNSKPPQKVPPPQNKLTLTLEPDLTFCVSSDKRQTNPGILNDRFIPSRKSSKMRYFIEDVRADCKQKQLQNLCNIYRKHVLSLNGINNFEYGCSNENERHFAISDYLKDLNHSTSEQYKKTRKIPKTPYKVLDAPALQDDFYLNLIDWSNHNILAVGLGSAVYLWAPQTGKVTKLCDLSFTDSISSLVWLKRSNHLAVGTNLGELQLWDTTKLQKLRTFPGHTSRIGSLAQCGTLLTSGSKDKNILTRDIRSSVNYINKLVGHKQQICGLKWSFDQQQLASGGNDNKLCLWSPHSVHPIFKFNDHHAAVKALAWSPHQHGLLASGGGTADKTIRFWNSLQGKLLNTVDTGSQVCNLMFSKTVNQIVSTHGYSQNQVTIWKYPEMDKIASLSGHSYRVLYLAMSPDGKTIVTGAGDETLRFWSVFPASQQDNQISKMQDSKLTENCISIR